MRNKIMAGAAILAIAVSSLAAATPADARWRHHHHGWRGGGAALGGFAAGALIGGALASRPYGYGYAYEPAPYYGGGGAAAYCAQRFKSWDPASGTYLGYDGNRHPCP